MPSTADSSTSPDHPSSYFTYPVSYAVNGLLRRLNSETSPKAVRAHPLQQSSNPSLSHTMNSVFQPPRRKASPFQPPPLTPLTLRGYKSSTREAGKLLSRELAEEIRLLVPPRLQLVDGWELAYSLEQNGVSLATLYKKAEEYRGKRGGFVLVVRDASGGVCSLVVILPISSLLTRQGIRRIPLRRSTPTIILLREWRVLSLARTCSTIPPRSFEPATSSVR